ncbi:unnamed protein product [Calicophoron daubneyi]|uniref:Uncharacterized protein n=1 Tax=Calicophoron daubneyi TaxID=300641 RepID=A0AAV2TU51_CALDB
MNFTAIANFTPKDKRVIRNFVKHADLHNRVVEEEHCWREILHRRRERDDGYLKSHRNTRRSGEYASLSKVQQDLDAYERRLRLESKRQIEELAARELPSAEGGKNASEFWCTLAAQRRLADRWVHDGFEELNKPGPPPPPESYFVKRSAESSGLRVCSTQSTARLKPKEPLRMLLEDKKASPPPRPVECKHSKHRKHKSEKHTRKHKKERRKRRKSMAEPSPIVVHSDSSSPSSSLSTLHSDEEIEWEERK